MLEISLHIFYEGHSHLKHSLAQYQVRSLGKSQVPEYTSRENDFVGLRSGLARLPSRNKGPVVDSYSSHMVTSQWVLLGSAPSISHFSCTYFGEGMNSWINGICF